MNNRIFVLLIVALLALFIPDFLYSKELVWMCIGMAIFIFWLFISSCETNLNIKAVFLRPSILFLIAYLIVFFQRPLDYSLGYSFDYIRLGDYRLMLKSLKYAIIGLCMFCIGYYIALTKVSQNVSRQIHARVINTNFYSFLSSVIICMLLAFVPRQILMGGYSNDMLTNATIYNYLASWSNMILIAYIVQFTMNAKQTNSLAGCSPLEYIKSTGAWQTLNVIIYTIIILNVGDRGPIIILALAYYISYIIIAKRYLSRLKLILILIIGIFISSILGETKKYRDDNTILDRLTAVFNDETSNVEPKESLIEATNQLAGSYCCLPIAMQMVPENDDYTYGKALLGDVVSSVPFIGRVLTLPQSASYRISYYALGNDFSFGLGTNCIASLYMDGGICMIIVCMFLFGFILRKFEVCIFSETTSSFFVFCLAFYFLAHVVYIPRSTLLSPFKYALWMYVIMAIYAKIAPAQTKI